MCFEQTPELVILHTYTVWNNLCFHRIYARYMMSSSMNGGTCIICAASVIVRRYTKIVCLYLILAVVIHAAVIGIYISPWLI